MTKQIISLASRKKLPGGKISFIVNHRPQDGIINKIIISDLNKFKKELVNQGMKSEMKIQLRLMQTKDKKIINLFYGTVGSPTNPSSFAGLVQSNLTRPSAQLRVYGGDTKTLEKGKIYGYSKINIPIAKETTASKNEFNELVNLNQSFLPIIIDSKLEQQIYQIDINHEDGPKLCLNKDLNEGNNPISYFTSNKVLQGVILQAAITDIYNYIYHSEDQPSWSEPWYNQFNKMAGYKFPDKKNGEVDQLEEAIDDIIKIFTSNFKVMNKANSYTSQLRDYDND